MSEMPDDRLAEIAKRVEGAKRPFGSPGHCYSIDGEWWHEPGTCPGATVNCHGRCCGVPHIDPLVADIPDLLAEVHALRRLVGEREASLLAKDDELAERWREFKAGADRLLAETGRMADLEITELERQYLGDIDALRERVKALEGALAATAERAHKQGCGWSGKPYGDRAFAQCPARPCVAIRALLPTPTAEAQK